MVKPNGDETIAVETDMHRLQREQTDRQIQTDAMGLTSSLESRDFRSSGDADRLGAKRSSSLFRSC